MPIRWGKTLKNGFLFKDVNVSKIKYHRRNVLLIWKLNKSTVKSNKRLVINFFLLVNGTTLNSKYTIITRVLAYIYDGDSQFHYVHVCMTLDNRCRQITVKITTTWHWIWTCNQILYRKDNQVSNDFIWI